MSAPTRCGLMTATAALAAAAALPTLAAPAPDTPFTPPAPDRGWVEAVVVVSDLRRALEFYEEVAGWRPIARRRTDGEALRLWGVRRSASATEVLLANAGDRSGYVRLVAFRDAGPQVQIRSSAMPWETGGVFSLMTRSRDLDRAYTRAQRLGFTGFSDPIEFDFGGVILRNVVIRGPDGVNIAIYQRQTPKLVGWSTIDRLSAPFNTMQMVQDRDRTRAFYEAVFGYAALSQADFIDPAPGPNNFALPANLVTTIPRRFAIMAIAGSEVGRVEAMQFVGLTGRDLSARSRFPNYGIAALRYPTRDLDALLARARAAGAAASIVVTAPLPPYGPVRLAQVRSPDGVIIEAMQMS